jgi:hypothetical protein
MTELTYAALRQIMYQPSAVWLATENSGDRWLTDQFVMLCVSGLSAVEGVTDGPYKLMADGEIRERDSIPPPDLESWFAGLRGTWLPAAPTEWSVAEHPGKAMLWHVRALPALMGEPTWTQIKRHYPDCEVEWLRERNLFRFSSRYLNVPFCYAAGIRVPDGQESIASEIARANYLTQLATEPSLEGEIQLATEEQT